MTQSPFLLRFGFPNIPGFGKKEKGDRQPERKPDLAGKKN
jgi:hypothetical protein